MSEEPQDAEKKLYVDEDWKSQVDAEKADTVRREGENPTEPKHFERGPMPPANLSFIVGTLYLQGAIALGLIPNPVTRKANVQLDQAKHAIDLLEVLLEKTVGNRTPEETEEMEGVLYELRMSFVTINAHSSEPPQA